MRFSVPRSLSPSPERETFRARGAYGLSADLYDSSSDEDGEDGSSAEYDSSDVESSSSTSSGGSSSASSSASLRRDRVKRYVSSKPTPLPSLQPLSAEQRVFKETVTSIRNLTRHHDEYEEWQRETREDAFLTARRTHARLTQQETEQQRQARITLSIAQHTSLHQAQMAEIDSCMKSLRLQQQQEEAKLRADFEARGKKMLSGIEAVITLEENKVKAKLEAERKIREEAERKAREEAERKRAEEEKKRQEAERKRTVEEEVKRQEEEKRKKEEEEKKRVEAERKAKEEALKAEQEQRKALGMRSAEEDWTDARKNLLKLKAETMKVVKATKELKTLWGSLRRQITPKIGQVTRDDHAINTVSTQIYQILQPSGSPAHPPLIYTALLSSLSKCILLQAETEVTAEKKSAPPLARVTFNLLTVLPGFADVLFAKIMQRVGIWAIPCSLPPNDATGKPWADDTERSKMFGYRFNSDGDRESNAEYVSRLSGIMRVYFEILKLRPEKEPLGEMFRVGRYWTWFARLTGEKALLGSAVAAELICTALDVFGYEALQLWGYQWVKMLALVYDGSTIGYDKDDKDANKKLIGGESTEGKPARARVQMAVEAIMDKIPNRKGLFS